MHDHITFTPKSLSSRTSAFMFVTALVMFSVFVYLTYMELSYTRALENLKRMDVVRTLDTWELRISRCLDKHLSNCKEEYVDLKFPILDKVASMKVMATLKQHPHHDKTERYLVNLTHKLSFSTLLWLKEQTNPIFVAPSFTTSNIRMIEPIASRWMSMLGADYQMILDPKIQDKGRITLQLMLHPLMPEFGSNVIPTAVASWRYAQSYADLDQNEKNIAYLHRARNVVLPLLITALLLVLNHSLITLLLSYIALIFSARTIFSTAFEQLPLYLQDVMAYVLVFLFAITPIFLLRLFSFMLHINWRRSTLITAALISVTISFTALTLLGNSTLGLLAAYNDTLGTVLGFALTFIGVIFPKIWRRSIISEELTASSPSAQRRSILFACLFLGVISAVQVINISGHSDLLPPVFTTWTLQLLLPALFFIALIHLGSIVNTIKRVSVIVKAKTKIDRDIEIGKELQSGILPAKKFQSKHLRWHAFYFPASHLAGDWFDLREVTTKDGRSFLLGCIVDVTGHGISSAMMTSNIASHWGLWCLSLKNSDVEEIAEKREELLVTAPRQIHRGLIGLRYNLGCSMAVIMYEPATRWLTYLTAGHPGIIVSEGTDFRYLTSRGTRPGIPSQHDLWTAHSLKLPFTAQQLILYTDGVVKKNTAIPVWLKQIRRQSKEQQRSPTHFIISQLRASRRSARKHPGQEDDLTLLIIKLESQEIASSARDEELKSAS